MTGPLVPAPWWQQHPDLLPPEPDLEPLHQREYLVRAYKRDDTTVLIRGAVMDLRPGQSLGEQIRKAGGSDDGRPLTVHHMVIDMTVEFPTLTILDVEVVFETHPQPGCPLIAPNYRDLIGLSIARGFTHEVRKRFGGPRGCSHTTALLQAMSPVAVQCEFSMRHARRFDSSDRSSAGGGVGSYMKDTCHIWAEDGELWQGITIGQPPPLPLGTQQRLREGGIDPDAVNPRDPTTWGQG